ncbi:MAG: hypothetical protein ACLSHA_13455 [Neglectibacter timonensis]
MQFFDINYQLAQADDKAQILRATVISLIILTLIHVQLTFINQRANMQDFARSIDIPIRGDEYDGIRREYGDMLKVSSKRQQRPYQAQIYHLGLKRTICAPQNAPGAY